MRYLLGIDVGTSSTKTLLTDEKGGPLALGSETYAYEQTQNHGAQQNPELWWQGVCQTIKQVIAQSGIHAASIAGIGLSGQMHGMVALGRQQEVLRPAIIWMDERSKKQMLQAPVEAISQITLNRPAMGFLALSLQWMKENEPEVYQNVHTVLLPKDYIRFRLTGELGTDYTDASGTTAFNPALQAWSDEVIQLLGLDRAHFPPCHPSYEVAGRLMARASEETGLPLGIPVVYGGGDNAMQNVGNGLMAPGVLSSNIGTGAQVATLSFTPESDKEHRVNTFSYVQNGVWSLVGASLSGGGVLSWLQKDVLHCKDYPAMDARAATSPPCPDGLLFLPYLGGERSPFHNPDARGVFFGLNRSHTDAHIIRSVMEGIVLSLRCSLEIMQNMQLSIGNVVASGGGARSQLWMQIQADIYNREICVAQVEEQACLGAAVTAAWGVGIYASLGEACGNMVHMQGRRAVPIAQNVRRYQHYFSIFQDVYKASQPLFERLAQPIA